MERTAANVANHVARQGYKVAVAYRERLGEIPLYELDAKVERSPFDGSARSLVAVAEHFRPDVIVYFYATSVEAAHIHALCQTEIPLVLHEGSNPERVINNNWAVAKEITREQAELERLATMAMCTRIRFTLPQYRDSLPPPLRDDSVSFPNAFAPADPADLALRFETGRKIFLNIGGLKKVKNVMAAVRAFALVAPDLPDWDFHIFSAGGKNNPARPELESFVTGNGLKGRVRLFPPTLHIGREYGRSHVHVIASKEEGLPNCVAEASRHGLPSIGFACCAGTNSMIVHEHNGLLVECGADEIPALAAAMRRAATDDAARRRWGNTALEESDIYAPERIFAQWEALIAEAAADRADPEERMRRRFGEEGEWRRLRAVQRASLGATPWPAPAARPFDEAPPLVSIVIPLFDKQDFIAETLATVAACSYPEKEVIVVDDCSTDASAAIAAEICARNGWRLIRHELNSGLSAARNTGLDAARGVYVHFWDADDLYDPDGIGKVLRAMHVAGADIGVGVATREGKVLGHYAASARDVSGVNYAQLPESFATASTCFKVYRRAFLLENELWFEPGLFMQDSAFNLCAFPMAERIVMTSAVLGEYRLVAESGTRQFHPARYASALWIDEMTQEYYAVNGLHALDPLRQEHVVGRVLTQFVRRARRDHGLIDGQTRPEDLDFEFLAALQSRLVRLSQGLVDTTTPSGRVRLACYAIREGYLNWLPELLCGVRPVGLRADLLAAAPAEEPVIAALLTSLKPRAKVTAEARAAQ